jgi:hypothetical protein
MKSVLSLAAAAAFLGCASIGTAATHSPRLTSTGAPETTQTAQTNQFTSESDARSHCGTDAVVWVNTKTHVYHFAGNASFGHTKRGAFMCRADADRSGKFHAAKNEAQGTAAAAGSTIPARR